MLAPGVKVIPMLAELIRFVIPPSKEAADTKTELLPATGGRVMVVE
jgi:hypothetical protein